MYEAKKSDGLTDLFKLVKETDINGNEVTLSRKIGSFSLEQLQREREKVVERMNKMLEDFDMKIEAIEAIED